MRLGPALASGIVGACALTLIHEAARHSIPHAPHVNALGERAIRRIADALGGRPPGELSLYAGALVGELASNSLFYALSGLGGAKHATRTGHCSGSQEAWAQSLCRSHWAWAVSLTARPPRPSS